MTTDFRSALRDEIVSAGVRQQEWRRRRAALVGGMAFLVAVVGGLAIGLTRPTPAEAGVDIDVHDGEVSVRLTDLESRPAVIESALRAAGIDAVVVADPVGPSLVGRFVGHVTDGPSLDRLIDERNGTFAGFVVPEGWPGHLELRVGAPAEADETYAAPSNAFAEGEPLACSQLLHSTLAQAAARLAAMPLDVRVQPFAPSGPDGGPLTLEAAVSGRGDWRIVDAQAFSAEDVILLVTLDGSGVAGRPTVVEAPC